VLAVANSEMVRAIRVVSVERGHDPREFALVAFGGAGPLHACDIADELGMRSVLVPPASGVLSALGIASGDRRRDAVRGVMCPLADVRAAELRRMIPWPEARRGAVRTATCDLRYVGQGFELDLTLEPFRTLSERFHERHRERYGFADPDTPIEVVNVRASVVSAGEPLRLGSRGPRRKVMGPAAVHLDGATLWVAAGWTARRSAEGGWSVTR
jgi:N-methylhydantoinase A